MENLDHKKSFLKTEFVAILRKIKPDAQRLWGKMDVQQMVEHMSDSVRIANNRDPHELVTPEENVPKMQAFLMSEKPFRENTPNQLLPDEPVAHKNETMEDALQELQDEIDALFEEFDNAPPEKTVMNPFFGALNFDKWVQLLHKHAWHHLRQFGVEPTTH